MLRKRCWSVFPSWTSQVRLVCAPFYKRLGPHDHRYSVCLYAILLDTHVGAFFQPGDCSRNTANFLSDGPELAFGVSIISCWE